MKISLEHSFSRMFFKKKNAFIALHEQMNVYLVLGQFTNSSIRISWTRIKITKLNNRSMSILNI